MLQRVRRYCTLPHVVFTFAASILYRPLLAQPIMPVIYDSKASMYVGAYDLLFLQKAVYTFQDRYIPDTFRNEAKPLKKALGFGYRMGKLLLLDYQEDYLLMLIQHEGFGHCARYREYGAKGHAININLTFPFGNGNGRTSGGSNITNYTPHKHIAAAAAGVEANIVMADIASLNFLQSGSIHYRQALIYLAAQNNQLVYIWLDRKRYGNSRNGADMNGYMNAINGTYSVFEPRFTAERFSMQSLVSLINPVQAYAAFTILYNYGIRGEKYMPSIPMIRIGKTRYLPYMNYNLTPFGSEYLFCNVLKYRDKMFVADLGINEGTYNNTYRLKAKALNIVGTKRASVNLHAEAWSQPELRLDLNTVSAGNKMGGIVKTDVSLAPFQQSNVFNAFAQLGYKTKGFTIGEPLDKGVIVRFGIGLRM